MRMRIFENEMIVATVVAVALVAGSGEPVIRAQEPGVSTDTKLKYREGDHPRLWVGDGRLAKIAERCAPGGCMNAEYLALKNKVDAELASGKTYL